MDVQHAILQICAFNAYKIINSSIPHAHSAVSSNVLHAILLIIAFHVTLVIFWLIILAKPDPAQLLIAPAA